MRLFSLSAMLLFSLGGPVSALAQEAAPGPAAPDPVPAATPPAPAPNGQVAPPPAVDLAAPPATGPTADAEIAALKQRLDEIESQQAEASASAEEDDQRFKIVNSQNPVSRLTASELRPIFQTNKRKWDNGALVEPVNLPEKSSQRRLFDKVVLGFDPDTALRYWIDRKVRGEARPPKKLSSPAAVLAHVASAPGGIGYVPAEGSLGAGVKVVARVTGGQVKPP